MRKFSLLSATLLTFALALTFSLTACTDDAGSDDNSAGDGDGDGDGGDGDGDGDGDCFAVPEECSQFVECAAEVIPAQAETVANKYGEAGSCWCGTSDEEAQECLDECRTQLDNAIMADSTIRECHGRWCPLEELNDSQAYGPASDGQCPDFDGDAQVLISAAALEGSFCSPPCQGIAGTCPQHDQTSAQGSCSLTLGGVDQCALRCYVDPFLIGGTQCHCGAKCRPFGGPDGEGNLRGLCTFDDDEGA